MAVGWMDVVAVVGWMDVDDGCVRTVEDGV